MSYVHCVHTCIVHLFTIFNRTRSALIINKSESKRMRQRREVNITPSNSNLANYSTQTKLNYFVSQLLLREDKMVRKLTLAIIVISFISNCSPLFRAFLLAGRFALFQLVLLY
jgi:hypothetical protein